MDKVKCCYCKEEMDFGSVYISFDIPEVIGHKRCVMAYCNKLKKGEQKMKQIKCCKCGEIMNVEDAYSNLAVKGAVGHQHCVLEYVQEKQLPYIVKLTLGDWSEDGHGKSKEYLFKSNYPVETIQEAYKTSCRLTGVQFNYNQDYTEGLCSGYGSWRQIFTEYEDSSLAPDAIIALREHGLDPAKYCSEKYTDEDLQEDNHMSFDVDGAADLIMAFIKLSMPKDWNYDKIKLESKAINGWWGKLNHQFGYGLFD